MNTIQFLLIIIQVLFIGRFHLELSKVNGFVEPVNTIRKITNPLVLPTKRLIPFAGLQKWAAILVAWLISVAIVWIFNKAGMANALTVASLFLISTWLSFLQYGMFLFVIGSWIQIPAFQRINYLLHNLFSPMLRPIQKILPSFGGLDFSPIAFLLLLSVASNVFANFVASL